MSQFFKHCDMVASTDDTTFTAGIIEEEMYVSQWYDSSNCTAVPVSSVVLVEIIFNAVRTPKNVAVT